MCVVPSLDCSRCCWWPAQNPLTLNASEHITFSLSAPRFICLGFFLAYRATLLLCTTLRCAREMTPRPQEPPLIKDGRWCINTPAPSPLRWDDSEVHVSDRHAELPRRITLQSPAVLSCLIKTFIYYTLFPGLLNPLTPLPMIIFKVNDLLYCLNVCFCGNPS